MRVRLPNGKTKQPNLFGPQNAYGDVEPIVDHDGATYDAELDRGRLNRQTRRVLELMLDGHWRTLAEIAASTGDPEASVSARLRDLRKEKFGAYTVKRRRRGDAARGTFEYRIDGQQGS